MWQIKEKMMKKLLTLMVLLAFASAAHADLDGWSLQVSTDGVNYVEPVDSEIILYPSDYLWIGAHNGIQGQAGDTRQKILYLAFADDPMGEWTGNWQTYIPPLVPNPTGNTYYGIYAGLDIWELNMSNGVPTDFNGQGVLDAKEFHCLGGENDIEIVLLDTDTVTVMDSFIIHQLPEPATIALLGLGGLLLRRRK
jgi:hypothetical protein